MISQISWKADLFVSYTSRYSLFSKCMVSQFMHSLRKVHTKVVNRILCYIKFILRKGILFKRNGEFSLEAYIDANCAVSIIDRRSTSRFYKFVKGNLVKWRSNKQLVIDRSSVEADFKAVENRICELLWLKIILEDLKIQWKELWNYWDNKLAINIAHNLVQHNRTKYVEMYQHFIEEQLDRGLIFTLYISTDRQLADILTKGYARHSFQELTSKLTISTFQLGGEH